MNSEYSTYAHLKFNISLVDTFLKIVLINEKKLQNPVNAAIWQLLPPSIQSLDTHIYLP